MGEKTPIAIGRVEMYSQQPAVFQSYPDQTKANWMQCAPGSRPGCHETETLPPPDRLWLSGKEILY